MLLLFVIGSSCDDDVVVRAEKGLRAICVDCDLAARPDIVIGANLGGVAWLWLSSGIVRFPRPRFLEKLWGRLKVNMFLL